MVQNSKRIKMCPTKNISPIPILNLPRFLSPHFPKATIITGNLCVLLDFLYMLITFNR